MHKTRQFFKDLIVFLGMVLVCGTVTVTHAQRPSTDSFKQMLKTNLVDTFRCDVLIAISEDLRYSNPREAMKYCKMALQLARKTKNLTYLAHTNFNMAVQLRREDKYSESIKYYYRSIRMFERNNDLLNVSRAHGSVALVYWAQGNFNDAMHEFKRSLRAAYELGDSTSVYSNINNIGGVFLQQNKGDSAYISFTQCLNFYRRKHDTTGIAETYGNVGDALTQLNKTDEALEYYKQSLYYARLKNHLYATMTATGNIGNVYLKKQQYNLALPFSREALHLSLELGDRYNRKSIYKNLAALYAGLGDYKNAYVFHQYFSNLNDSLQSDENNKQINELKLGYDIEKKDQQIKIHATEIIKQKEEGKRKDAERNMLLIGIVLVLILTAAIFIGYRQKNRAKKEQERKNLIIETKNKEILDSINYARKIQYALLAHDDLLKQNLPEHFVFFKPKDIVSGDFYWGTVGVPGSKFQVPTGEAISNSFYLAVCDSTGHGVPGAFMSLLNISFLNEAINEKGIEAPNEVFNHVRKRLIENVSHEGAQDGMDATLIKFEIGDSTFEIQYAAAYNAPLVIRNGEIVECKCDKMPIGKGESSTPFNLYTLNLQKGDMLYLYTDGYTDQFGGERGKKLKESGLRKKLTAIADKSCVEQRVYLENFLDEWTGNHEQVDDICVLGIKI